MRPPLKTAYLFLLEGLVRGGFNSAADVRTFVQSGRFFARSKAPILAVISDARGGWVGPGSTSARVRRFSL